MTVYIPHKDTLFLLARLQRSFIASYNQGLCREDYLFPQYPLYAFADDGQPSVPAIACEILAPVAEKTQCFFPFELETADGTVEHFKIVFATGKSAIDGLKASDTFERLPEKLFPLHPRSWQRGRAVIENNSWQIFDTAWCKA